MTKPVWPALLAVYVIWGSTYLAIRWTVETAPPSLSAAFRFGVSALMLLAIVLARRGREAFRMDARQAVWSALSGVLLLGGGNGLVVIAETRVASGLAALLVAVEPLWIVVLTLALKVPVARTTLVGVVVGLLGATVLLLPGSGDHVDVGYSALILAAALSWAVGSMVVARRPVVRDSFALTTVQMAAGTVALTVVGGARGEFSSLDVSTISLRSWLSLGYLVVFGSLVAFTCYAWLLRSASMSLVSTYAYVNPAVAVGLGVLLAGERLRWSELVGGLIIVGSVALVVIEESRHRDRAPVPV